MGDVFARTVLGLTAPTIGLLNVGSEELKGDDTLREAAEILRASHIGPQFHGFVEGHDIAAGTTDVVVTDGFTGNVALKTGEGALRLILDLLRQVFTSSLVGQAGLSAGTAGAGPAARVARSAALQRRGDGRAERRGGEVARRHRRGDVRPCRRRGDGHGGAPVQRPDPPGPRAQRAGQADAAGQEPMPSRTTEAEPRLATASDTARHTLARVTDAHPFHPRRCRRLSARADRQQRRTGAQRWKPPTRGSASAPASASATSPARTRRRVHGHRGGARRAGRCRRRTPATWTPSSSPPPRRTRRFPRRRCGCRRRSACRAASASTCRPPAPASSTPWPIADSLIRTGRRAGRW